MSKTERQEKRHNRRQARRKEIKWDKLDNTAHLFPVIAENDMTNVYRICVVLKEEIQRDLLQQALDEVLPLFPVFNSRLRQGMFWFYFEENGKKAPKVQEEHTYPCQYIEAASNRSYLFRVTYFKNRINLEVFHVLTDGTGGTQFLRELTYKYLRLAHPELADKMPDALSEETSLDVSDSYVDNFKKSEGKAYKSEPAYIIEGPAYERGKMSVIHGFMPVEQVKAKAKKYGASINEYLVASLLWSIYQKSQKEEGKDSRESGKKLPITASVPVNLRPFFDSTTTKNFFAMITGVFQPKHTAHTFQDVLDEVKATLREQLNKEHLEKVFSYNVSNEKKLMLRAVPLLLKKPAMKYVYNSAARANTTTVTNMGNFTVKKEYEPYIESSYVFISRSKGQDLKGGVSSYNGTLCFTITSVLKDVTVQSAFYQHLLEEGISLRIETNGVAELVIEKNTEQLGLQTSDSKDEPRKELSQKTTYPEVGKRRQMMKHAVRICWIAALVAFAVLRTVAIKVGFDRPWDYLVGGCLLYLMFTFHISFLGKRGYRFKMIMQTIGALLLVVLIDIILGFHGWSLNYVVPGVFVLIDVAILILMIVNSRNWQSYIPIQILVVLLSLCSLIFYAINLTTEFYPAMIGLSLVCIIFIGTVLIGGKRAIQELRRRFHI